MTPRAAILKNLAPRCVIPRRGPRGKACVANCRHGSLALAPAMARSLVGEVAYVTGASAGIGASIAKALHAAGATVWLGARRTARVHAAVTSLGTRAAASVLDVTDRSSRLAWLEAGTKTVGPCTILVNNAGLAIGRDPVHALPEEAFDAMINTNVVGALALCREVVPGMRARGRGDIAMLGSIAAREPYAGGATYCASKAAMTAFARGLRGELNDTDVRVLLFEPGLVETEFSEVRFGGDKDKARAAYTGMQPLSADDVAECVAFALTRPRHVSLDSMIITAQAQDGTRGVSRRPVP
jgi:3-hydroxy acid dehydrogenase / malonic semialdehyde reductase